MLHRRPSGRRPSPSDKGFVLVTAIWLLALCAAVALALMWLARERAQTSQSRADEVRAAFGLEGAVYDVLFDILSRGEASRWAQSGGAGAIDTSAGPVQIRISLEAGRIDLNAVDLDVLDTALRGLGYGAGDRDKISRSLLKLRAANHRLASWSEAEQILEPLQVAQPERCIADLFTLSGGTARPDPAAAPPALAEALDLVPPGQRAKVAPGQAVRVRAVASSREGIEVIARVTGLLRGAYSVDSWRTHPTCGA